LLDFTLVNFQQDIELYKIKDSSNLYKFSALNVKVNDTNEVLDNCEEGRKIKSTLSDFHAKFQKYKNRDLHHLFEPLSEIIRINPEHSHDKNISEKIFSKVFWQLWAILDRPDQQYLAEGFNKLFQNLIRFTSVISPQIKTQFARTMLEQVVALKDPQVRIEPETLQYLGKHFNMWHVAIP